MSNKASLKYLNKSKINLPSSKNMTSNKSSIPTISSNKKPITPSPIIISFKHSKESPSITKNNNSYKNIPNLNLTEWSLNYNLLTSWKLNTKMSPNLIIDHFLLFLKQ